MQRKVTLLMVLVILLGLLAGCQQNPAKGGFTLFESSLSDEVKAEIRTLYYEEISKDYTDPERVKKKEWIWDYTEDGITYTAGYRYYGTFGNSIVWYRESKIEDDLKMEVAGSVFQSPNYGVLYVYRRDTGTLYHLRDAYEQRLISAKDVATVAEYHASYNEALADGRILLDSSITNDPLFLSEKQQDKIRQAYAEYLKAAFGMVVSSMDNLTVRPVWRSGDIYALYVDFVDVTDGGWGIRLKKPSSDGETPEYYEFTFPDGQELFIYKKGSIYTLKEAYDAGVLKAKHLESLLEDNVYQNDSSAYYDS